MINLIVADDHVVLRDALCQLLQGRGNYKVVGQAGDGNELLSLLKNPTANPDLILLDIEMPNLDGIETLEKLSDLGVHTPVLVLSADGTARSVKSVIAKGAKGYMPKNVRIEELEFAIDSILQGNTYLSPSITAALIGNDKDKGADVNVLTKREVEILRHLADGKPNRDIGKILHISSRTVDTHRSNILKKLKVKTNAELVKIAIAAGLIDV